MRWSARPARASEHIMIDASRGPEESEASSRRSVEATIVLAASQHTKAGWNGMHVK